MQTWRIPVYWKARNAAVSHPFIDMEVAPRGAEDTDLWRAIPMLVDTGASISCLDQFEITRIGCQSAKSIKMTGNFGAAPIGVYPVVIRAKSATAFYHFCEAGELAAETTGRYCSAILGLDYLQFGTLHIEGPGRANWFDLEESRIREHMERARHRGP